MSQSEIYQDDFLPLWLHSGEDDFLFRSLGTGRPSETLAGGRGGGGKHGPRLGAHAPVETSEPLVRPIDKHETWAGTDDYAGNTSTTGVVSVGGSTNGNIETAGDTDWFRVNLIAGTTYRFDVEGADTSRGTLADPYMRLRDSAGGTILVDDDSGSGYNARISFTAPTSGVYYISAGSASSSGTGTYRVSATATSTTPADDYAASTSTTGSVSIGSSATGNIETAGDTDWFRVNLVAGTTYQFDVEGTDTSRGTLADPYMRLRDSSGGTILVDDDSGAGYNARISFTAATTGVYYISAGSASSTGTGTYRVSAAAVAAGKPDLVIGSMTVAPSSIGQGGLETINFTIVNNGSAAAAASTAKLYLSTDATIDGADTLLTTYSVGSLAANGGTYSGSLNYILPNNLAPGTYYIGVIADATGAVSESNEANNSFARSFTVTAAGKPDLVIGTLSLGAASLAPGGTETINFSIVNNGSTSAPASTAKLYLSTDATIDGSDTVLQTYAVGSLAANGGVYNGSLNYVLPSNLAPGTYYIGVIADTAGTVGESNEANNSFARSLTVTAPAKPDLVIGTLSLSATSLAPGAAETINFSIVNNGSTSAPASTAKLYLSTDAAIDGSDTVLQTYAVGTLAANGGVYNGALNYVLPNNLPAGTYYIGVIADTGGTVSESNEANNSFARSLTVTAVAKPDLVIGTLSLGSASVVQGGTETINFSIVNNGSVTAGASTARLYLSTDATIDGSDTPLQSYTLGSLAANGGVYNGALNYVVPSNLPPGTYYIGLIADTGGAVSESNEANNSFARSFSVTKAPAGMTGEALVALAQQHIGEDYYWEIGPDGRTVKADYSNAHYVGPWDCAEFVSWCVFEAYGKMIGATAAGGASTGQWMDAFRAGSQLKQISIAEAQYIPGAILLHRNGSDGHICISEGNGKIIEANVDYDPVNHVFRDDTLNKTWAGTLVDPPPGHDIGEVWERAFDIAKYQNGYVAFVVRGVTYNNLSSKLTFTALSADSRSDDGGVGDVIDNPSKPGTKIFPDTHVQSALHHMDHWFGEGSDLWSGRHPLWGAEHQDWFIC